MRGKIWQFQANALAELTIKDSSQWKLKDPAKKPQVAAEMLGFSTALRRSGCILSAVLHSRSSPISWWPKLDSSFGASILRSKSWTSLLWTSSLQKQFSWPVLLNDGARCCSPDQNGSCRTCVCLVVEYGAFSESWAMPSLEPSSKLIEWKYSRGVNGQAEPSARAY